MLIDFAATASCALRALNEIITISEEIDRISKQENNKQPDPKLRHLLEIIKKHFNNSKKPVLVFAKYLATERPVSPRPIMTVLYVFCVI